MSPTGISKRMAWGLDIGTEMVRLCRARMRRGQLQLQQRAELEVPRGLIRPSLKDTNVVDPPTLFGVLRALCGSGGYRGWVRLALPDAVFMLRTLSTHELPAKPSESRQFLRWQARDLLPFPAEEARIDFLPPISGSDGRLRVICLIARDRILAEYEQLLADAGVRPAVLDARSVTLAQAASSVLGDRTSGLLAVGETQTTLLVVEAGRPRFSRILPAGKYAWASRERSRLFREVGDSITFCYETEGIGAVDGLTVSGLGAFADGVVSALGEWLELPVRSLDLRTALGIDGQPEDLDPWGPAIGAAIRPC